ncbi:antitermination protein [Yersinia enterocolitica]
MDKEKSEQQGIPVYKTCGKCSGRGYSRLKFSDVYEAIREHLAAQRHMYKASVQNHRPRQRP